jgi:hypothetical protein
MWLPELGAAVNAFYDETNKRRRKDVLHENKKKQKDE